LPGVIEQLQANVALELLLSVTIPFAASMTGVFVLSE
jgi:hypothetical protein